MITIKLACYSSGRGYQLPYKFHWCGYRFAFVFQMGWKRIYYPSGKSQVAGCNWKVGIK